MELKNRKKEDDAVALFLKSMALFGIIVNIVLYFYLSTVFVQGVLRGFGFGMTFFQTYAIICVINLLARKSTKDIRADSISLTSDLSKIYGIILCDWIRLLVVNLIYHWAF